MQKWWQWYALTCWLLHTWQMQPDKGKSMMSIYSFISTLSAQQNMYPSESSFSSPHVSNSLLCSSRGSNEASEHIPEQGNGFTPDHAPMHNPGAPESFDSRGRTHLAKQSPQCTCSTHGRLQVSSFLTQLHDRAEENGAQGMDRRDHGHDVQSCKKKYLSFRFCLLPYFDNILLKCPFFQP